MVCAWLSGIVNHRNPLLIAHMSPFTGKPPRAFLGLQCLIVTAFIVAGLTWSLLDKPLPALWLLLAGIAAQALLLHGLRGRLLPPNGLVAQLMQMKTARGPDRLQNAVWIAAQNRILLLLPFLAFGLVFIQSPFLDARLAVLWLGGILHLVIVLCLTAALRRRFQQIAILAGMIGALVLLVTSWPMAFPVWLGFLTLLGMALAGLVKPASGLG